MDYRIKFKNPIYDISILHKRLVYYFRYDSAIIWYVQNGTVWVRSTAEPLESIHAEFSDIVVYETVQALNVGEQFSFRIKMNTVKRRKFLNKTTTREMTSEEALLHLETKAKENGFTIKSVQILEQGVDEGYNRGNKVSLYYTEFVGQLEVEDAKLFNYALGASIGRAGVYGMGMLRVRPLESKSLKT